MKRLCVLLSVCLVCSGFVSAQDSWIEKPVNWGFKVGLNSELPSAKITTETPTLNVVPENKVGYLIGSFVRLNMKRIFIQPELSYNYSHECFLLQNENRITQTSYNVKMRGIDASALIGYNTVKEKEYLFSLYSGCNIRYAYQTDIERSGINNYTEKHAIHNLYLVAGIGASISHIIFDFRYGIGLFDRPIGLNSYTISLENVALERRTNTLSFSFGFMF